LEGLDDASEHRERVASAVGFALLEIRAVLAHGVGDVCETKKPYAGRPCKGVECGSLHLDAKNVPGASGFDRFSRFAKGSIRCPGCTDDDARRGR
jgi:hypothetical protein